MSEDINSGIPPVVAVGNDVVDLREERQSRHTFHPRFPERILAPSEWQIFQTLPSHDPFLWIAWAAKEAAYKIMKQREPLTVFSPAAFVWDHTHQTIKFQSHTIPLQVTVTPDSIFAQGSWPVVPIHGEVEKVTNLASLPLSAWFDPTEETYATKPLSQAVRLLAKRALSQAHSIAPTDWYFEKSPVGQPIACVKSRSEVRVPLSFTHHGRFVGVTFPL